MATYQFLLQTSGIRCNSDGENEIPAIGFYTSPRARAKNSAEAYRKIMAAMDGDQQLGKIIQGAHAAGLRPKTEAEKFYLIPWWKALLPWRNPGLNFSASDADDD